MYWHDSCTDNHWFWFWPFGFFIILFIVFGVSRLFWWHGSRRRCGYWSGSNHQGALDVLKKRYAAGEVTKEQFEKIKQDILVSSHGR